MSRNDILTRCHHNERRKKYIYIVLNINLGMIMYLLKENIQDAFVKKKIFKNAFVKKKILEDTFVRKKYKKDTFVRKKY